MRRLPPEQPLVSSFFGLDDLLGLADSRTLSGVGCSSPTCQLAVALFVPLFVKVAGLNLQLSLESANSAFIATGELSAGAIADAEQIYAPGELTN